APLEDIRVGDPPEDPELVRLPELVGEESGAFARHHREQERSREHGVDPSRELGELDARPPPLDERVEEIARRLHRSEIAAREMEEDADLDPPRIPGVREERVLRRVAREEPERGPEEAERRALLLGGP